MITAEQVMQAANTGALFFDSNLQPVQPKLDEWFCEMDWDVDYEGEAFVQAGGLVKYLGTEPRHFVDGTVTTSHRVVEDGDDEDREPSTLVLIRQGY